LGHHNICTACSIKSYEGEVVSRKVRYMRKRMGITTGDDGDDGGLEQVFKEILESQQYRDYYTLIPFVMESGHPFSPSPDRVDRSVRDYSDKSSVVASLEILNVGGGYNWDRRTTLQVYFADQFSVDKKGLTKEEMKYFNQRFRTIHRTAEKRSRTSERIDNSGHCTVTKESLLKVLKKQQFRCALSGIPLVFEPNHKWTFSFDRIDNTEGYVDGNIRFVITRLNPPKPWTTTLWTSFLQGVKDNILELLALEGIEYHQESPTKIVPGDILSLDERSYHI
jgi:hypothetical protein